MRKDEDRDVSGSAVEESFHSVDIFIAEAAGSVVGVCAYAINKEISLICRFAETYKTGNSVEKIFTAVNLLIMVTGSVDTGILSDLGIGY